MSDKMKFLKTNWKILASVVIGAFLIYITLIHDSPEVKALRKANKTLQNSYDSILKLKKINDTKIDSVIKQDSILYQQLNFNSQVIESNNKEINRLKKVSHEKINNVGTYSAGDLDSFFRSRYHY